ncbi:unnamed protein product [Anisakis simplex]|uniref:Uncharacterized protein n=1 Tax=Anisakis simplex TaxID=6269 RepID=A0A3P6NPI6_ANISI|nr:unnamed protein product [Anisakis simplex]
MLVIGSKARIMSSSLSVPPPNRFRVSSVGQSNHELRLDVPPGGPPGTTPITTPTPGMSYVFLSLFS